MRSFLVYRSGYGKTYKNTLRADVQRVLLFYEKNKTAVPSYGT